jgi:O-antigen/teichoic acid export membrane protein
MSLFTRLLFNTTSILLSFQMSTFLIPWLFIVWLTYNENTGMVGEFGYVLAIVSPLCMLMASPSRNFLLSSEQYTYRQTLDMRKLLAVSGFFVAVVIGLTLDAVVLVTAIYLAKITELFFDLNIASTIKKNNTKALLNISILKWISIFLVLLSSLFIGDITALLLLLSILFIFISLGSSTFHNIEFAGLKNMLLRVFPLSVSALVFSLYFNIPRYVLGQADHKSILAVFTISSFLLMGSLVLINTIMQSRLHVLSRDLASNRMDEFTKSALFAFFLVFAVFLMMQICRLEFFSIPFWNIHNNINNTHPEYNDIYQSVLLMSWGPLLFSFSNYFLILQQRYKSLLILSCLNTVVSFVLCIYAFKYTGFNGLLWIVNISGLVQFVVVIMLFLRNREIA